MIIVVLLAVALIGALAVACWCASTRHDKRHVTAVRLKQRAWYENSLVKRRDPRGFWGQYPPAPTHDHLERNTK
jgi:hypothetical protein